MPRTGFAGNTVLLGGGSAGAGTVLADIQAFTGTQWNAVGTASGQGDANAGGNISVGTSHLYSELGYDRPRNNTQGTLLASASRSATTSSADQTNFNARGVRVFFNVTVVPGVDTVTLSIEEKDPVSGNYVTILTGLAVVATGQQPTYVVYPGSTAAGNQDVSTPLPRTFRVTVTHSAATAFTYSVGYAKVL